MNLYREYALFEDQVEGVYEQESKREISRDGICFKDKTKAKEPQTRGQ